MRVVLAALLVAALPTAVSASAPGADAKAVTLDRPALVGILDTGVDRSTVAGAHLDDAVSGSEVPGEGLEDLDGHGTEMASIVHALAPQARLAVVKVVDRHGATTDERVAAGIDHLRRHGASVVLLSLAGAEPLPRTREAIERAAQDRVLVVAAAGNDGLDLDRAPSYPGGYRIDGLVTVAALDTTGALLGSSNRGGPARWRAPGQVATCGLGGRPTTAVGTSAAAAVVAGRAAGAGSGAAATIDERIDTLERTSAMAAPSRTCPSTTGDG